MDIENKLDEDFLFYLGFTGSFANKFTNPHEKELVTAWLQKLCGEKCTTVDRKRNRNIFLSNLVLCMEEGKLVPPFNAGPNECDLQDPQNYFGPTRIDVKQPDWFSDVVGQEDEEEGYQSSNLTESAGRKNGRTYVATRTMPGGEGAFAYVAITLATEEPRWLGGGEGDFDRRMEQKFAEYCPPQTEMEKILAKRKNPREREKVLTFYDVLLKSINDELDDKVPPNENATVNGLINQLISDLKQKGEWKNFEGMQDSKRRVELLLLLFDRIHSRRQKIAKRESMLDDIEEALLPQSFFETTLEPDDKFELPSAMWEQAINKAPSKKHMEKLQGAYPLGVIEKFLEFLANYKEELAVRLQRRHEHIVAQMRKELRKEGEKGLKKMEEAQMSCDQAIAVLKNVRAARQQQMESEKCLKSRKKGGETIKTRLYDEMRQALFDTQRSVEEEAARGRMLSDQINAVNEQTELFQHVNEDSILKTEEANIAIMRNIKRLQMAIKQYETRLHQLQAMNTQSRKESMAFFI